MPSSLVTRQVEDGGSLSAVRELSGYEVGISPPVKPPATGLPGPWP